jgi:DNA-binding transcriptional LysR family regulator
VHVIDFHLRVFLAAAKTGSFTKASEILNISQPAVTHQIKSLEERLKTRLFNRMGNKICLTEPGQILVKYAEEIQRLYLRAARDIAVRTGQVAGEIPFGATHLLGKYYLPRLVGEFRKGYPDANLSMLVANSQEIVQYLREGIIELAIVSEPLHLRGMTAIPFYRDHLTVIVYPGHRWCDPGEIETAELFTEGFIAREPGSGTREVYTRFLEGIHKGKSLRTVMVFGSTEAIKTGVMGEMGFSIISRLACRLETEQGLLREIRLKGLDMKRDFYIVFRSEKHLSLPARAFKDYLVERGEPAPAVPPASPTP